MQLVFFNWYGNGDLLESREFVLEFMRLANVSAAQYAYQDRYLGIFADLPQLSHAPLRHVLMPHNVVVRLIGDTMYVNTWVGRNHGYVLEPGVGCVIERIYQMWNDMLVEAGLPMLPRTVSEYLPTIDYTRIPIHQAVHEYLAANHGRKLVLVCNGKTTSNQAGNFDYHQILNHLKYREHVRYLFTERVPIKDRPDVVFTDDLTNRESLPNRYDLNVISYLSRYCDIIIGRCSGAQMFAQVLENWMDSRKTLVCLTRYRNGACFVRNPESLGLKMRVLWSPEQDQKAIAKLIRPSL